MGELWIREFLGFRSGQLREGNVGITEKLLEFLGHVKGNWEFGFYKACVVVIEFKVC